MSQMLGWGFALPGYIRSSLWGVEPLGGRLRHQGPGLHLRDRSFASVWFLGARSTPYFSLMFFLPEQKVQCLWASVWSVRLDPEVGGAQRRGKRPSRITCRQDGQRETEWLGWGSLSLNIGSLCGTKKASQTGNSASTICAFGANTQHPHPIPMARPNMLCGMGSAGKYLPTHPAQEAQGRGKPA